MSQFGVGRFAFVRRFAISSRRALPYLIVPGVLALIVFVSSFRPESVESVQDGGNTGSPLVLPNGWPQPPIPADNPITWAKFYLGRQLFYEKELSGDGNTSCGSCHDSYVSFTSEAGGPHGGAFNDTVKPLRNVPRLINLAYDTVLFWDGHAHTLEQQVHLAVMGRGDLQDDTGQSFQEIASNPAYEAMFTNAFGDGSVTLDRIAMAIATFERCMISGNSQYDQYLAGNTNAMSASAIRGMNLFFDTLKTNCSDCHNNLGSANPNTAGQTFSDNNYYRTGTFEFTNTSNGGSGYGFNPDTTRDTLHLLDAGRAAVTKDSNDIGKFRTPTLRNVCLTSSFGAEGNVHSLAQLIEVYNMGGTFGQFTDSMVPNQDPRIKPLKLDSAKLDDLAAFINSLDDLSFISNQTFQDPGPASIVVAERTVSGNLSVYPNPAKNFVNAESPAMNGLAKASLISENGATVWQSAANVNGRMRLDFTGVPNGVYRLEITSNGVQQSTSIVLQR